MKPAWDKGAFAKHRCVIRLDDGSVIHCNAAPDGRKVTAIIASTTKRGRSCEVYDRREDKLTKHSPAPSAPPAPLGYMAEAALRADPEGAS